MPEDIKPVNLPFTPPDLVGQYELPKEASLGTTQNKSDYSSIFNTLMNQNAPKTGQDFPSVSTAGIDMSGRYPTFFPGRDNEEMYAQRQSGLEKAYNGVAKMAGVATTTFLEGTAGLVYGVYKGIQDGKVSSFYNNDLTNSFSDFNKDWENKYAHYKTERERNGSWWEPSNLFTGNFLWDNIVKNLGFSLGAVGAGFAWGGALKAVGLTSKLAGAGAEMASAADTAIAEASLLPQAQRLPTVINKLEGLWNGAKVGAGKGLMKADQGIVATFGTVGEAGLEALNNSQEFRQKMIEDFKNTHGYDPTTEDLKEIDNYSASVGNSSLFLNAALLTATNYIQLPKIYGSSFKAEKNILNSIKFEAGKYAETLPTGGFGKLLYKTKNVGSLFFNTAEAFEEGAQYAIQTGTQNYYGKRLRKEESSALDDGILYGVNQALTSDEGWLNISTGGLSGALQSSGVFGFRKNDEGKYRPTLFSTGKIGERGATGYGGESKVLRDDAISALNGSLIKDKLKYSYSSIKAAEIIQKQREAAIRQGDVLESKDLEFDYAHTFVANRLKYNAKESIDFEINSLKREASTEEGFRTLQQEGTAAETDTRESFLNRLDNLQNHANNTAKLYDAASIKYKGLVIKETGERVFSDNVIDKLVYAASKVRDYDNRIPQISTALFENGINVQSIIDDIIQTGTPNQTATKEALDQINKKGGVNKDDLKTSLMDVIEMSLRRAQFLNEYDDIKANPKEYDGANDQFAEANEVDKVLVKQSFVPEDGGRKRTIEKELEVGKEYSLGQPLRREGGNLQYAPKMSVLSKTLGGEYEVILPNGNRTFLKPGDFKAYNISDIDVTSPELNNILDRSINNVLSRKKYQDIAAPNENKLEFINSLNNDALAADIEKEFQKQSADYMEQQKSDLAKKQRLLQYAEQLKRTQEEIEKSSGDFPTQSVETDKKAKIKESRKKPKDRLYKANISASLDDEDADSLAPHIIRYNEFINNVKNLSNDDRQKMKAILVTSKQEKFLNIEGLGEMSFKGGNLDVSKLNDKDFGFIGMIFIKDDNGKKSFVDKDGKVIGKLGDPIDINKIVFSTMPSASLFYNAKDKNGNPIPRYRDGERDAAMEELAGWSAYREKLSEMADDEYVMFDYGISKGIPIINKDNPEKNFAGGVVFPESKVAKEKLIEVVTKGNIAHEDGQNYKFPNGRPVAKYKDNLEFLNNTSFSKQKATAIYGVFKRMSDRINQETLSQKDLSLEQRELAFIQNVLYWNSKPEAPASDNKVFIDSTSGDLVIGENRYDFANIGRYENQIIDVLQNVFHSINNKTLNAGLSIPFYEFYINSSNELVDREWKNYQQYLLSSKYPDGSNRTIDDAPLVTNISKPTPAVPFSFKQKYAYLKGLDFPVQSVKKKEKPEGKGITIDKYKLNDGTINDYEIAGKGIVKFVATQDANGVIDVITEDDNVTGETITKIAGVSDPETGDRVGADETLVTSINNNLKELDAYDEKLNVYENAEFGISTLIKAKLLKLRGEFKAEEKPEEKEEQPPVEKEGPKKKRGRGGDLGYRRVGVSKAYEPMSEAEIEYFKKFAAKYVPGIPYEFMENMIMTYDNEQAFGVFEGNVAKIFKGGMKGSAFHELMEGIWFGFLSPDEQAAIIANERTKKGTFVDRETGKTYDYNDPLVSDLMIKERIMDDFPEFVGGKIPAKSLLDRVIQFFRSIINFFKSFVRNPSLKEQLFKDILVGKFKKSKLTGDVAIAPQYRRVPGLSQQKVNDYVQDIIARVFQFVFSENKDLFNYGAYTSEQLFGQVKEQFEEEGVFDPEVQDSISEKTYDILVERTKDRLKQYRIEFDEDSRVGINDEGANRSDYAADAFTVDFKKSSPYAVKLLISTLIKTKNINQVNASTLNMPDAEESSTGGYVLLPFGQAWVTLTNRLSNTRDIPQFINKLYSLAKENSDYIRLFKRLGGDIDSGTIDFESYTNNDWRLFIQFYQSFTKSKPDAITEFVEGNQYYSGSSNQANASKLLEREWMTQMRLLADHGDSIIKYDKFEKVYKVDDVDFKIDNPTEMVTFLDKLGITFPIDTWKKLKNTQPETFAKAVSGIKTSLNESPNLISLKNKTLGIGGNLSRLAQLYISVESPSEDSTFFNEENKRQQSFTDSNAPSYFESVFNSVKTKDELIERMPQLQDVFSTNSQVLALGGLFFDEEGNRTDKPIKVGFIGGTKDKIKNKGKRTSDLSIGNRFSLEINQNLDGNYYVLIPADGSTEWMMNLGNSVSFSDFKVGKGMEKVFTIFQGYLKDDIALAKDAKNRSKLSLVGKKANELRFFKDILSKDVLDKANKIVANKKATDSDIETFINDNIEAINADVEKFINDTVVETKQILINNKQIIVNKEGGLNYSTLDNNFAVDNSEKGYRLNKSNLTDRQIDDVLTFANANYIINNIEYHKILFGDPYQFKITDKNGKVILDETKRIKSFLSPRRITFDSQELNDYLDDEYNKAVIKNKKGEVVNAITLTKDDYGYHEHKSYAKTFTARDINIVSKLYPNVNEADASSLIMDVVYREVKTKNGQWPTEAEDFHQWQMAYTRNRLAEKGEYTYEKNTALQAQDIELLKKRTPDYKIEVLKPIVSTNKFNKNSIDLVLDKFSQLPLYYKAIEGTNLEKFYIKMFKEKYDYMVVESGRKVGAEGYYDLYKKNGELNDEPFNNTINVPWNGYGIQVENSYEKDKLQTRGSQLTKLATLDLYRNGEPIGDKPERQEYIKQQVEYNKDILERMYNNGYKKLLKKLGIIDLGGNYIIEDKTIIANTLRRELLKREMSENAIDSITINPETNDFDIAFEASTNYKEIRDILYSIIDKMIAHPKMNGFSGVQVASTMFESDRQIAKKTKDGYVNITKEEFEQLSEKEKDDVVLTSGALKFYEDENGKRYCEVLLPNWMSNKFSKSKFPTEQSVLTYLNSPEGREILTGIGFRIPTQALSSVEVFVVKGFLPEFMGRTVVVPSEITTKSGSDFDIDKLNMYLKNVYVDENGDVRIVRYKGSEETTKNFYADVFDNIAKKKIPVKKDLLETLDILENSKEDPKGLLDQYGDFIDMILEDEDIKVFSARLKKDIEDMSDNSMRNMLKDEYMDKMYDKSLENEYYKSLETLIQLPENFERLTKANESKSLEKIASLIDDLRGEDESVIKNRLLNRNYMTSLRHSFIVAKKWVGIGAVNVTGNSLTQKEQIIVKDPYTSMVLPHNSIVIDGQEHITLSGILDRAGEYISDKLSMYINAFVDVAKDPYILKIIYSDRIVGTVMMLERFGVPMKTTALFMNQPIIREFVNMLDAENAGPSAIYNKKKLSIIRTKFSAPESLIKSAVINPKEKALSDNISDYYKGGGLTEPQNAEQQKILDEFIEYSKLAKSNFIITQAINYDTTKFRNADDINRKQLKTELAEENNLISSPKKILESSSLGELSKIIDRSSDALSAILKFNLPEFRQILKDAIRPYSVKEFMSSDRFNRISDKLGASFLDYIIQTNSDKIDVGSLVTGKESVADRIVQAKIKHPDVKMLDELVTDDSGIYNGTKTIRLKANIKDSYEENLMIGYMREMKAVAELRDLYDDVVKIAIVQGNYQSAISIKNIVPLEDYARIVSPIIETLVVDDNARNFAKLNWFQRNNYKDQDAVTRITPTFWNVNPGNAPFAVLGTTPLYRYYSPSFRSFEEFGLMGSDRKIMTLPDYMPGADMDVVTIPRIILKEDGEMIDFLSGETVTPNEFRIMKTEGSTVPDQLYGYQKVKYPDGVPVMDEDSNFVYKMINLHGDGQYASEYYKLPVKSVLNNNTVKIDNEMPDADVFAMFPRSAAFSSAITVVPSQPVEQTPVAVSETTKSVADVPQNKVSGVESFGSLVTANDEVIKALGPNPHSIDMIEAGFRTRTTRSEGEMAKYAVKVGDIIKNYGRSADDTTKTIYARVTAIHPKGSPGWKGTWSKEGWSAKDVNVIDKFKDGAAAIEFEIIKPAQPVDVNKFITTDLVEDIPTIAEAFEIELITNEQDLKLALQDFTAYKENIEEAERLIAEGKNKEAREFMNEVPKPSKFDENGNVEDAAGDDETLLSKMIWNYYEDTYDKSPARAIRSAIDDIVSDLTDAVERVEEYKKGNREISPEKFPDKKLDVKDQKCKK